MAKIRGSYPGGPRREPGERDDDGVGPRAPRLESAEDFDERRRQAFAGSRARRRQRRAWSILAAAIVLAGGAGLYLGFRSHRSSEQLTEEREAERQEDLSSEISDETTRMLMELWRMEDVEYQRNRGSAP